MAATKFPSVSDVNLKVLYKAIDVPEDAIIWCREHGLLKQHRPCDVCGRDMPQHIINNNNNNICLKSNIQTSSVDYAPRELTHACSRSETCSRSDTEACDNISKPINLMAVVFSAVRKK